MSIPNILNCQLNDKSFAPYTCYLERRLTPVVPIYTIVIFLRVNIANNVSYRAVNSKVCRDRNIC